MFRPSHYSELGAPDDRIGAQSASGAAGAATAATGLAKAAGASATVPVVGWVVGGTLAAAAGTVGLVAAIKRRRVNKSTALRWARRMKLSRKDAEDVAGFVVRLQKRDASWRRKMRQRLSARLQRIKRRQRKWRTRPGARRTLQVLTLGIMRGPQRLRNQRRRVEAKLGLIQALEQTKRVRRKQRRERRRERAMEAEMAPMVEPEFMDSDEVDTQAPPGTFGGLPIWGWVVAVGAVGGAVYLLRKDGDE